MPSQPLEALIEDASRHLSAKASRGSQVARPMDGLMLLRHETPSVVRGLVVRARSMPNPPRQKTGLDRRAHLFVWPGGMPPRESTTCPCARES